MADTDIVQVIAEARIDARSLSEFVFKPAGFKVARRLAPAIDTLQFYIDRFDATDAYAATIPTIVNDAINNTAIEGGVLADTFVTMTKKTGLGTVARTLRDVNSDTYSVKDFGAKGDGVTDDTAAIQAAIDSGNPIYIPRGVYRITSTIKTQAYTYLRGMGSRSIIFADNVVGPAILTYSGVGQATAPDQDVGDFSVAGQAECAVAFAHCTVSNFSNIRLTAKEGVTNYYFEGKYGFVFEYFWGSHFNNLYTNGSGISDSCFKFNQVLLANIFTSLYTSNISKYSFNITDDKEFATGVASGHHGNTINTATAQRASLYGIRIAGGRGFTLNDVYTEACQGSLQIHGGNSVKFNSCGLAGLLPTSTHSVHIDGGSDRYITDIVFNECVFHRDAEFILGKTAGPVHVNLPRLESDLAFWRLVRRNGNTSNQMPLTVKEKAGSNPYAIYSKTNNYAHKFSKLSVGFEVVGGIEVSKWQSNPIEIPPLTEFVPNTPVVP